MKQSQALDTDWMRSLGAGDPPSHESLREHLLAVHREHPGFTESCAMRCRDDEGRTSYEWLVDLVRPDEHAHVVDLACGSGPLLELCHRRFGGALELTGIDMSHEELDLARRRLPHGAASLHRSLADDLGFVPDGGVDVMLCHWALTLMDPVAPVLEEANRVLRPGGTFAAVIDGDMALSPGYEAVHHVIYGWVQREFPCFGRVDLGDARVRDGGSLACLSEATFHAATVTVDSSVFSLSGPPDMVAREAAGFFYAAFVLSPPSHRLMLAELEDFFAREAQGGSARFDMPINRLVVHRR
ncbi:MAG: class I SAM-dependent methyltransferase [Alphaproteobacteria bacterium]